MNPWIPAAAPDVRLTKEVVVSREGFIRYETNRYSVPADFIGQIATVKVDTLERTAAVFIDGESVRSFKLLAKGAKSESIRKIDADSLVKRWQKENRRTTREIIAKVSERQRTPHSSLIHTEVDTRHPGSYDKLMGVTA